MRGSTVPLAPVSQKVGLTGAGFVGRRFQKKILLTYQAINLYIRHFGGHLSYHCIRHFGGNLFSKIATISKVANSSRRRKAFSVDNYRPMYRVLWAKISEKVGLLPNTSCH